MTSQLNKTLLFYVREARKAARLYGISHPEHLTKFVYLGVICAPFFWEEPKAKAFLAKNNEDPNARFSDFYSLVEREARNAPVQWVLSNGGL